MDAKERHILAPYVPLFEPHGKRYVIMRGGAGAGKTYHMYLRILLDIVTYPDYRWLCIRKTRTSIPRTIWQGLTELIRKLGLSKYFVFRSQELTIEYTPNGNFIWFSGIDDPDKLKGIENVVSVWMEEADQCTADDLYELSRRLRPESDYHSQIVLTFNPVNVNNWVYKEFFETNVRADSSLYLHTTYRDNPYLPAANVTELEVMREIAPYHYQVYALGEWGSLDGLIYQPWQQVAELPTNPARCWYGLDFGHNVPSALVKVVEADGLYYMQEVLYRTEMTTHDIIAALKDLGVARNEPIYCDAAEPDRIADIYRAGYNAQRARKDVGAGINYVQGLHGNLRSWQGNVNLHKEHSTYAWRKDRNGQPLDAPEKVNDHALDAMRYALYTHLYKGGDGKRTTFVAGR